MWQPWLSCFGKRERDWNGFNPKLIAPHASVHAHCLPCVHFPFFLSIKPEYHWTCFDPIRVRAQTKNGGTLFRNHCNESEEFYGIYRGPKASGCGSIIPTRCCPEVLMDP